MLIHRASSVVTTLVGTHVAVSVASIARATLFGKTSGRTKTDGDDSSNTTHAALLARTTESFDANHYAMLTEFVSKLYSIDNGQQKKKKSASSSSLLQQASSSWGAINLNGVRLAPTAVFEDPAAICVGKYEIEEAFEALTKTLHPTHVNPPICVDVQPQGDSIDVWYKLDQHYSVSGNFSIKLVSLLTVTVQLEPLEDVPEESEFVVTEMKEYWHGNPFMWPQFLFYPSKRLNGIVSYQLTSRFL